MTKKYNYDVAISFAGEDRDLALQIADKLKEHDVNVFYDKYEADSLWGKDLYEHLADVYNKKAKYCLMIISKNYAKKSWTSHERRHAQARAFNQSEEYILPLRLDETKIPGIAGTVGYIRYKDHSIEDIVDLILKKLKHKTPIIETKKSEEIVDDINFRKKIPIPKVRKEFNDKEKEDFLHEAFKFIKKYFSKGLEQLKTNYKEIEYRLLEIHNLKFVVKIYRSGVKVNQCMIWIGSFTSTEEILYRVGKDFNIHSDTSFNEYINVIVHDNNLLLKYSSMGFPNYDKDTSKLDLEDCSELLWYRFTNTLEH